MKIVFTLERFILTNNINRYVIKEIVTGRYLTYINRGGPVGKQDVDYN